MDLEQLADEADRRDRVNDVLRGVVLASCFWLGAFAASLAIGAHAVSKATTIPEPQQVFRGADGETITTEDLVDEAEPYMKEHIRSLPWGTRHIALKLARWFMRKHIEVAIAQHGHQIAGALKVVEPLSDHLFKPEPAARIRGLRRLCETDPAEFGAVAVEARRDAGPVPVLGRSESVGSVGAPKGCLCGVRCDEGCSVDCGCVNDK